MADATPIQPKRVLFDPTINLGHILTAICMIGAGAAAWSSLDKRVTVLEEKAAQAVQRTSEQAQQQREALQEMKGDIRDVQRTVNDISRALVRTK